MLEGDLTDFTVPEILRLLEATGKTGRLTVTTGSVQGSIDVRDGAVAAATASTARQAQIVDAVFDLVRHPTGRFRFAVATGDLDIPADDGAAVTIEDLLVEVTGRLVRWHDLVAATGELDDVVSLVIPASAGVAREPVTFEPDVWDLITLVDGRRTVADLIEASGQGAFRTRTHLAALRERGVAAITPAVVGSRAVGVPTFRPDPTLDEDLLDRLVAGVGSL